MRTGLVFLAAMMQVAAGAAFAEPAADLAYGRFQRGLFLSAHEEALKRLHTNPDDAAAKTLIGEIHLQGLGLKQDAAKAAGWYRLAALRDPNAAYALAMLYLEGRGVEKNPVEGRTLLEQAALRGHPAASFNLALLVLGENRPEQAIPLLERAASFEIAAAQHALGVLALKGTGMAQDKPRAASLFARATANGDAAAEVEYAILLFNGEGVTRDEARAARLFRRSALRGNAIGQNRYARLLAAGRAIPKNIEAARFWHERAKAQGLQDEWLEKTLAQQVP